MSSPRAALVRGTARVVRAATAGVATGALAVLAHAGAGGALPGAPEVAALIVAVGVAAAALGGRERGPLAILALVVAGQAALHGALSLTASGHAHHAAGHEPVPMLLAHVLATAVTVVAMTRAERVLFALLAALAARLPRRLGPLPVTDGRPAGCPAPPRQPTITDILHRRVHTRRGPPGTL
ncbi:hypothetical protein B0I33_11599 [Prauserella shujinwangii]|uniref:Uncharacterized protein n=1 Tax=Prauserella shujinwangii TaxID=1453103 RepID=A0A2T0LKV5_9PSEU|nr:hypothetical protein [Prauserella shujinwangii]PRX43481.1 hypothetical protein B0I33_11599 [Prauserella shujinwangii]